MGDYRPRVFDGDVMFFAAALDDPTVRRAVGTWRRWVNGRITNHPVDATHWQITEPKSVEVIGPLLAEYLVRRDRRMVVER